MAIVEPVIKNLHVLAVSSDESLLECLEGYFEIEQSSVLVRTSAREATDALRDHPIALVIADGKLAQAEDYAFIRLIRANYPHIGLLVLVPANADYPVSAVLSAGADGCMSLPITHEEISLLFEREYWEALSRPDWWATHAIASPRAH